MSLRGTSKPYVMVPLQPGAERSGLKTKVVIRNLNPVFNETSITMVKIVHLKNILIFEDLKGGKKVAKTGHFLGV